MVRRIGAAADRCSWHVDAWTTRVGGLTNFLLKSRGIFRRHYGGCMELLVHVPIPRERWPLAFRAAVAMAIGVAVAWMVVRWTERFDDGPRVVEAGAPDGEVIAIAVLVAATACLQCAISWCR